jgi:hypothetical protein
MANRNRNTQLDPNQSPDTVYGLAQMKKHWRAEDGQIEECSAALWDSWPVREALKEFPTDPEAVLATLAGRMFLAGGCNAQSAVPSRAIQNTLPGSVPGSDPTTAASAAVNAFAKAIYALPNAEETISLAEQFEHFERQPEISAETRSLLAQVVLALLALKQESLAAKLERIDKALLKQIPQDEIDQVGQDEIDRVVEDILRRSEEEGGAA